jgi:hypothetical protein
MKEIELPYVTIRYNAPIVYFVYKEGAELGFPEIRKLISCAEELSKQQAYVTFADARVNMNITQEGKRFLADGTNMPLFRGTAALVKNNIYKLAANMLAAINKSPYPFRAFVKEEEAISWLLSLPLVEKKTKISLNR